MNACSSQEGTEGEGTQPHRVNSSWQTPHSTPGSYHLVLGAA
jgi:hypothetical protein